MGRELDRGDILFIKSTQVDKEWRRHGVATALLRAVLSKMKRKVSRETGFFAVVNPGALDPANLGGDGSISLAFWRAARFRRIGVSSWFAFTDQNDHPSRLLEAAQDWDPPKQTERVVLADEVKALFTTLRNPQIGDVRCLEKSLQRLSANFEDPRWLSVDSDGRTFLHLAAMSTRRQLTEMLLSMLPQLAAVRDKEGYTPLEALRVKLDLRRTRFRCVDSIRQALRFKYGCTCGQCIGGFMSPRMTYALMSEAEARWDQLHETLDLYVGAAWVEHNDHFFSYLPHHVCRSMRTNKAMRQGFVNLCRHFSQCLQGNRIPSAAEIIDVAQHGEQIPVTQTFLDLGGSVASVANMLFETAMDADEWTGDGCTRYWFGEDLDKLPVCRSDHEFGFVSGMCGYTRHLQNAKDVFLRVLE